MPASPAAPKPKRSLSGRRRTAPGAPKPPGRIKQIRTFYQQTSAIDPSIRWWTWGSFLIGLAIGFGLLALWNPNPFLWVVYGIMVVMIAAMAASMVMMRRGERAAYGQIAGEHGAAMVGLKGLRGGWIVEEQPIALDPRTKDMVFRAIGPAGIVLVGEGTPSRVAKLLAQEERRVKRVASGVPVTTLQAGQHEGQIPVDKLARHIMKIKGKLTKSEISDVQRRMKALGGMNVPIPKGIDPTRVRADRRAMRGR